MGFVSDLRRFFKSDRNPLRGLEWREDDLGEVRIVSVEG